MAGALLGQLIKPAFTIRAVAIFTKRDLAVYNPDDQAILSTSTESTVDETNENDMTKFTKYNKTAGFSNPQCFDRENSRFEVINLAKDTSAFCDRRPRKDSKFWDASEFLVWDLQNNCQA